MVLVTVFLVTVISIPVVSILLGAVQTKNWTPPIEATPDFLSTDIYTQHEAYNRYEDRLYKEM